MNQYKIPSAEGATPHSAEQTMPDETEALWSRHSELDAAIRILNEASLMCDYEMSVPRVPMSQEVAAYTIAMAKASVPQNAVGFDRGQAIDVDVARADVAQAIANADNYA